MFYKLHGAPRTCLIVGLFVQVRLREVYGVKGTEECSPETVLRAELLKLSRGDWWLLAQDLETAGSYLQAAAKTLRAEAQATPKAAVEMVK